MSSRDVLGRLFPTKYNFFDLIGKQAQLNSLGISALNTWLQSGADSDGDVLERCVRQADEVRLTLEKDLVDAFSTPIDRGDLYLFSVEMDKVIEYAFSTLLSMKAFGVEANTVITDMSAQLKTGADLFLDAVQALEGSPEKAERLIPDMRKAHISTERLYIAGMAELFESGDPMHALKLREICHHIKDASSNLDYAVDTLHKIIVGLT